MSDREKEETVPKGSDWEVVALTESTYAAAPSLKQDTVDYTDGKLIRDVDAGTAHAMLMSGHFGPSLHEDLSLEIDHKEKLSGEDHVLDDVPQDMMQGGKSDSKHEENLHIEGLISEEFPGVPQIDDKGRSYMTDVDTGKNAVETEPLDHAINPGTSNVRKHVEKDKFDELLNHPCEAWWKKHAASLCGHAKNVNPFWSIVVTAAVVGLVIIGHRWQRDKPHIFHLESQLAIGDKESVWIFHPMAQLKDVSLSSQHTSYI